MQAIPTKRVGDFLNLSRWMAALFVAAGHSRQLVMADYGNVAHPNLLWKGFYFLTQFGHEAVMVFFVISGFLIGGRGIARLRTKGFDPRDYMIHRLARIYTVLLPTLLLLGLLDWIGLHLFTATGLYTKVLPIPSIGHPAAGALGPVDLLGNVLLLQKIAVPALGTNGPLWSLANEWWYYMIFAAGMVFITSRSVMGRAVAAVAVVALLLLLPAELLLWGTVWLLGAGVAIYGAAALPRPPMPLSIALAIPMLLLSRLSHTSNGGPGGGLFGSFLIDLGVGLAYSLILLSMHRREGRAAMAAWHERLSSFSYSLYLIHFPLMVFLVAGLATVFGVQSLGQPSMARVGLWAAIVLCLMLAAWIFAQVFEARTDAVRKRLSDLFGKRGAVLSA